MIGGPADIQASDDPDDLEPPSLECAAIVRPGPQVAARHILGFAAARASLVYAGVRELVPRSERVRGQRITSGRQPRFFSASTTGPLSLRAPAGRDELPTVSAGCISPCCPLRPTPNPRIAGPHEPQTLSSPPNQQWPEASRPGSSSVGIQSAGGFGRGRALALACPQNRIGRLPDTR